jgi:hypothetical protein
MYTEPGERQTEPPLVYRRLETIGNPTRADAILDQLLHNSIKNDCAKNNALLTNRKHLALNWPACKNDGDGVHASRNLPFTVTKMHNNGST